MNLPDNFWQDLADHMLRGQKSVEEYERERFAVDHNPWENPKFTNNQLAEIFPEAKNILIKKYKDLIAQHKIQLDSLLEVNRIVRNKLVESTNKGHYDWYAGILEESESIKASILRGLKRVEFGLGILQTKIDPKELPGNIGPAEIERAKQRQIQDFYSSKLRKQGKLLCGLCPIHNERTASFFIYPNNTWYCQGGCGGGDVIAYVMRTQNLQFIPTIKMLLNIS